MALSAHGVGCRLPAVRQVAISRFHGFPREQGTNNSRAGSEGRHWRWCSTRAGAMGLLVRSPRWPPARTGKWGNQRLAIHADAQVIAVHGATGGAQAAAAGVLKRFARFEQRLLPTTPRLTALLPVALASLTIQRRATKLRHLARLVTLTR